MCLSEAQLVIDATNEEQSNFNSELESKQQEVILQLSDDISFVKSQLEEAYNSYQKDIKELQKVYDTKILTFGENEESLRYQIEQLKEELVAKESTFSEYK